jgi:hypothetical protein
LAKTRGFLAFSKIGTPHAKLSASPATGQRNNQGSGKQIMSYQATTLRNAFAATALAFVVSLVMLASTVSVPLA